MNSLQVENDWFSKFDFAVDEGKERLNPSREKNEGEHRRRKVGKSCVTPAGTSTSLTSRINGMTTHAHIIVPSNHTIIGAHSLEHKER